MLFLLLALPGIALSILEFFLPFTARGAGLVELVFSLMLLVAAVFQLPAYRKVGALLCLLPFLVLFGRTRLNAEADGRRQTCMANLNFLADQVSSYRQKQGKFPATLKESAMRSLPLCPSAGRETYEAGYVFSAQDFTVCCKGAHHCGHFYEPPWAQPDYPCYSSVNGKLLPSHASTSP